MSPERTPEEEAALRVMTGVHYFCAEVITIYGPDSLMGRIARRVATRARIMLIDHEDPDRAEVQDRVHAAIEGRRERIETLLAK